MFEHGRGVPQDYQEAARWYRLAAEQGHDDARFDLARAYSVGQGVSRSDTDAAHWLTLAAQSGHVESQGRLAVMYGQGRGVSLDDKLAYVWSDIAFANNGSALARINRDVAASHLSPAELAQAQRQAEEWKQQLGLGVRH
jgi:TPR repeat protein